MTAEENLADLKATLEMHQREQHTPEYEVYLRTAPPRPWDATPQRLQFSQCNVCQMLFEMIVDAHHLILKPVFISKRTA